MNRFRATSVLAALCAALVAGCSDSSPIPHTPTHILIVSGSTQAGHVSTPLDSSLVVQVLAGGNRAVSGVSLTWSVTGGGSVTSLTTTTDNNGQSTNKWTLAPTAGVQAVTVTSTQITGASVSFIANNGAIISGTVTTSGASPFATSFSRAPSRSARFSNVS